MPTQDNAAELFCDYGKCQCGCGEQTNKASQSRYSPDGEPIDTKREPYVTVSGHWSGYKSLLHWRDRFWDSADIREGECWEWQGTLSSNGYGIFSLRGNEYYAHRVAWEFFARRRAGDGLVCHHCDNRKCVNPEHLYLGDAADNARDMVERGRSAKGEDHSQSKLSQEDVLEIRRLSEQGLSNRKIAKRYPVVATTIDKIVNRDRWTHV